MNMNLLDKALVVDKVNEAYNVPLSKEQVQYLMCKRSLDVILSFLGLILLTPLFLLLAILIKVEDPKGPVFFSQTRVGKNGKLFKMYKFRSMVRNAEEKLSELIHQSDVQGAMFKMKHDPRITKVGRVIRKSSLDELPQLLNVLRGNMSLVGPRPPLPREVSEYTSYDLQRLQVVPGCTGLWQVSGRNSIGFQEMVELDLKYIRERTFKKDLYILLKTVKVLVGSDDAY
ncbi:sugar transferase [Paenibacillus sp. USHLN196]|uniref:sugar transferase n=1 Tax=Paenibacillus sp. USHLN196 TaxID=3081291 RepID=UPI0030172EDC